MVGGRGGGYRVGRLNLSDTTAARRTGEDR